MARRDYPSEARQQASKASASNAPSVVPLGLKHLDEQAGDPDLEDDDPAGGNVEDEGELASDGDDRGTGGYITFDEWREIKRLGRVARRRAKR